ncbi:MAG: YdeI/OmpD-associated family protein [Sandaracinaceae bacterium]|nr:YdeI/OmpD-associated family protein [Sandaracinaceae bacterium]
MSSRMEAFFEEPSRWWAEAAGLRVILLDAGLGEALKWGKPCYTHEGRNIAILQKMNGFLALMFFKGALLDDPKGLLEEQGENSRSALRLCFTSVEQVAAREKAVRGFVRQAVRVEATGAKVAPAPPLVLVEELQARLDGDEKLKAAFEALTPGRQRAYNLHVSGAKQSATRARRVEQHVARILAGKGPQDR